jgi:hypothetical protein
MILFRRFLVLVTVIFWLGGFTFYASVVVPIGQQVLGSHFHQGLITRQVAPYLNLASGVVLVPLAWDIWSSADRQRWRRMCRWLAWGGIAGTLIILVWMYPRMNAQMDVENWGILDGRTFRSDHRWYLWISSVQWGFGIITLILMLLSWRAEDTAAVNNQEEPETKVDLQAEEEEKKRPVVDISGVAQSPKPPADGTSGL